MDYITRVGGIIVGGIVVGKICQQLKVPQVVGYIILGFILGRIGFCPSDSMDIFAPLLSFSLGFIGFIIGLELKREVFKKYGRTIYIITVSEALFAFSFVFVVVTLITKKIYLGLLLGAIASATDPVSTVNVLWERKSRGPLTTTLTSIVALDDGVALILYGIVNVFSKAILTQQPFSFVKSFCIPLGEIFQSFFLGWTGGFILVKLLAWVKEKKLMVAFILGVIALTVGTAVRGGLDVILCSIILGMAATNLFSKQGEDVFSLIRELSVPFYIFFFVIVGASVKPHILGQILIIAIILGYLLACGTGKILGATLGGLVSKAKKIVVKYTGVCLLTQGGVAMGLAMSIAHSLTGIGAEGKVAAETVVSVLATTTFILQLVGPFFVNWGVIKADEVGRNVTEEDILNSYKVEDVMDRSFVTICEDTPLAKIIETIKEKESYHFPIVNRNAELVGLISLENLRAVLAEEQLNQIILAKDVASNIEYVLYQKQSLKEAMEIFGKGRIDFLPVVKERGERRIVGVVEYHPLRELVHRKLFERQHALELQG